MTTYQSVLLVSVSCVIFVKILWCFAFIYFSLLYKVGQ